MLDLPNDLPTAFPDPDYLTLGSFSKGVITVIDKSHLPVNALEQADNNFLAEDGQLTIRPGVNWYGSALPNAAAIDGFDYFDFAGVVHIVAVGGGNIYRSTDNAVTWTLCTGATLTTGVETNMNQNGGYLYFTNGTDNIVRYDGTTTLQTYTVLTTPNAPTVAKTGLAGTGYNYYYKVSAANTVGFSIASVASAVTQTSVSRETWDATTNFATVTVPAFQGTQTRADIYISTNNIDYFYLSSTEADGATWKDDGTAIAVPSTLAPTGNTSQGPLVKKLVNVGSRMYGIRDTANRYRIWFSGSGNYSGAFSSAYDGGYLDWQKGGKYIPVDVEDYRDGKGTPLATVWCDSADGQGCILQMSLDVFTVQDVSITIPSAYKLPGSRGTPAPGSVVNVLNDFLFYNSQAIYNLGSRAQYLNLLSTDEISSNIRPSVRRISSSGESSIASTYFDADVYFSVPIGGTTNNTTMVLHTSIKDKPWMPTAFGLGFKKFLRYTEVVGTTKTPKLLCIKSGDTQLSEINKSIKGDYGVAFTSTAMTGLYPTCKNRFEYQYTEEAQMEFSNPTGDISIELIGIERTKGFSSQGNATITSNLGTTGWDTFLWDTTLWDDTSTNTYSESSVHRYFRVGKELRAVQWRITTSTLDAGYVLRTLQTWGTQTNTGMPRTERLNRVV